MGEGFDKFLAIPTSQKVALFLVLMGLVAAAWYFLYFEATQSAIAAELNRTPQLTSDLAAEKEIAKNIRKYQEEIERLEKQRNEMRDRLPDRAEIADLLGKIHGQAKIVGLDIERFEREDEEAEGMYARIPVNMRLAGDFQEIATFFFYLGRLTRIVNVENIQLVRVGDKEAEEGQLKAICTATTFRYLPPGEAAKMKKKKK